jgi:hypothetical protein
MVFTILFLELIPLHSVSTSSDQVRVKRIMDLIEKARFSIHDLSRNQFTKMGEYARFNLPFELGLAVGCKRYGGRKFMHNKILILDKELNAYDRYIGDLSGQDIEAHANDAETIIKVVRDWMARIYPKWRIPLSKEIWKSYSQFMEHLESKLSLQLYPSLLTEIQMNDFIGFVEDWISEMKNK